MMPKRTAADWLASVGLKVNRWTIESVGPGKYGKYTAHAVCDCGTRREVRIRRIIIGKTLSCGCFKTENLQRILTTHGKSKRGSIAPEYDIWRGMRGRCNNPRANHYEYYGGRGISVCKEWDDSFAAFYEHIGPRPSRRHSLDRIDNDGNYEPGNVRWAVRLTQARNMRNNVRITAFGEDLLLVEWADRTGIPQARIRERIFIRGWHPERAVSEPINTVMSRKKAA